jgi:formylglycine-generating enzyme required for sulfatase activity/uncharacterized protein with von Willebrand factor type A (vWA) domain
MQLPLLDLFIKLRETGLSLTIKQYEWVLDGLIKLIKKNPDDIANSNKIKGICRTVWVKSKYQQSIFEDCWNKWLSSSEEIVSQIQQEIASRNQEAISQKSGSTSVVSEPPTPQTFVKEQVPPQPTQTIKLPQKNKETNVATAIQWKSPFTTPHRERNYFPVSRKQLEASWEKLQPIHVEKDSYTLDIEATIKQTVQQGFFTDVIYQTLSGERQTIVLLIDTSDSMIPFEGFSQQLQQYWYPERIYFFRDLITTEVYEDYSCWQPIQLNEVFELNIPEKTNIVIFSDVGVSQGREDEKRINLTKRFVRRVSRKGIKCAWINPFPIKRWHNTTALEVAALDEEISQFMMFPLEKDAFEQMICWLKGDSQKGLPEWEFPDEEEKEDPAYYRWDVESRIKVFELDYGKKAFSLATYAAFPLGVTPDLLFYLRQVCLEDPPAWYTVADILLSGLVNRVEGDLYEFEAEVRKSLLTHLNKEEIEKVATSLQDYIRRYLGTRQAQTQTYCQAQKWTALAYTKPNEAAAQLARALKAALVNKNKAALIRLSSLTETLADAIPDYQPLVTLANGLASYVRGDFQGMLDVSQIEYPGAETEDILAIFTNQLSSISLSDSFSNSEFELSLLSVKVAKLKESLVKQQPLELFEFETVFVNKRGEIIETKPCQAYYYLEPLQKLKVDRNTEINQTVEPLTMIYISEGELIMGSDDNEEGRWSAESPQHRVNIAPFYMSQTPITQAQWRAIASQPQVEKNLNLSPANDGDDHPVRYIGWDDAIEFCARLSNYTGRQYRLPSEAEWEYACRGFERPPVDLPETDTEAENPINTKVYPPFHFGDTITDKLANYQASTTYADESKGQYRNKTTPVRSFPPNAFGLYDMHGNVYEWCLDPWPGDYNGAPDDGSVWDDENQQEDLYQDIVKNIKQLLTNKRNHVLRGGSFSTLPRLCRSAYRCNHIARDSNVGFRVVCVPPRSS